MKIKSILILLSLPFIVCCQNKESKNKEYSIDYQGKELSSEETQKLFAKELEKFDKAINASSEITLVDEFPKEKKESKKEEVFELKNILGKDYYKNIKVLTTLNKKDFLTYYNSLNDELKYSLISSTYFAQNYSLIKENLELKKIIIEEFDRFKKLTSYNRKNSTELYKLNFLIGIQFGDLKSQIITYLNSVNEQNYNFKNSYFIYQLSKIDKLEALNQFKILINKQNSLLEKDKKLTSSLISTDNKMLIADFLFSNEKEIINEFIDVSIKTFKKDLYSYSQISTWIGILWNSKKLNYSQKKSLIESIHNSKDNLLINISKKYKTNLLSTEYLEVVDILSNSTTTFDLVPISKNKLTSNQKEKFREFLKENEKALRLNSKDDYSIGLNLINENLNSKTTIDYYHKEFSKVGYNLNNFDSDSLRLDLLTNYLWGADIFTDEFPQFFLNKKFISSFTADIHFDTESGEFPNNYPELIKTFSIQLKKHHNIDITSTQNVNYTNDKKGITYYEVYINSINTQKIYKIKIKDTGDWFAFKSIIQVLNSILKENKKEERFISVNTGDQTSRYILMKPASFLIIDEKIKLNI